MYHYFSLWTDKLCVCMFVHVCIDRHFPVKGHWGPCFCVCVCVGGGGGSICYSWVYFLWGAMSPPPPPPIAMPLYVCCVCIGLCCVYVYVFLHGCMCVFCNFIHAVCEIASTSLPSSLYSITHHCSQKCSTISNTLCISTPSILSSNNTFFLCILLYSCGSTDVLSL